MRLKSGCKLMKSRENIHAGGGDRTRTTVSRQGILSPLCLPISPPRHMAESSDLARSSGRVNLPCALGDGERHAITLQLFAELRRRYARAPTQGVCATRHARRAAGKRRR